ncbi:DUF4870 domain-containing protein [Sporosarcina sp. BI001-red]|uniref:DUF4870 domain-containing protein n=1 Tax=Sporosarcina sp. BI001-red TaxID=2282866 RepID=UPI000E26A0F2|nr:DUF4870 domain-containing protein [Sporosarcina sp. BI001-red]REB06485.1 DUF4870 domain-containing protein [Sporosarcina sp. BI001-red]
METKGLKILIHASPFFAPFLIPVAIFIMAFFVELDEQVKRLSIQALLFQLVMGLLIVVSAILSIVIIGLPFLIGFLIMTIIIPIIAIIKTLQDEPYNYPIVGNWF